MWEWASVTSNLPGVRDVFLMMIMFISFTVITQRRQENRNDLWLRFFLSLTNASTNDFLECESKVFWEEGIDAGIEGRVTVPQPKENREDEGWNTLLTKSSPHVHYEEREPADYESANDYTCGPIKYIQKQTKKKVFNS